MGADSVRIVVAVSTFRGISVDATECMTIQRGESQNRLNAAIDCALSMISSRGWESIPASVCVPAGSVSYRSLHFPFADPKRIAQTLAFELDGKFAQPNEELVVDHVPAVSGDGAGLGIVAAQPVVQAETIKDRFKAGGVDVRVVTCGAFALAQVAGALGIPSKHEGEVPASMKAVSLVLDVGHRSTEIAVLSGHEIVGARSFRFGEQTLLRVLAKHQDKRALYEVQLHDPLSAAENAALEPLSREVERLIHWLAAECRFYVTDLRLAGEVSRVRGLDMWLASEVSRPCQLIEFEDSKVVKQIAGRGEELSWAAIGAAHAGSRRSLIDLQSLSDAAGDESELLKKRFVGVALMGTCILACAGVDTLAKVRAESRQRDAYQQELQLLSQGVFGAPVSDLDGVKTLLMGDESNLLDSVPSRGALDVFALITQAALPSDAKGKEGPEGGAAGSEPVDGKGGSDLGSKADTKAGKDKKPDPLDLLKMDRGAQPMMLSADGSNEREEQALSVVPVDAGIVSDDRLYIRDADIREHKVVLSVAATRGSAKDRLKRKLAAIPCMKEIVIGATRDYNEFKQFDVTIEHDCYFQKTQSQDTEEN